MDGFRAPLYDAPLMDAIGETRLWTFQNRIDWVCEALMVISVLRSGPGKRANHTLRPPRT